MGKFLDQMVKIDCVHLHLSTLWALHNDWKIFPMNKGFFLFHFHSDADRDHILLDGQWIVDAVVLALAPWSLNSSSPLLSFLLVLFGPASPIFPQPFGPILHCTLSFPKLVSFFILIRVLSFFPKASMLGLQ